MVLVISKTPEDVERLLAPFDENLEIEEVEDAEYGNYWHNPKARWDYWRIGGRWRGELIASDGLQPETSWDSPEERADGEVSQAQKKHVDFDAMGMRNLKRAEGFYDELAKSDPFNYLGGRTRDQYLRDACRFTAFAVLTPDGEWHERGRMAWFGCVADEREATDWAEEFRRLTSAADPESWFTVVDVHI